MKHTRSNLGVMIRSDSCSIYYCSYLSSDSNSSYSIPKTDLGVVRLVDSVYRSRVGSEPRRVWGPGLLLALVLLVGFSSRQITI